MMSNFVIELLRLVISNLRPVNDISLLLIFASLALFSAYLLADCYRGGTMYKICRWIFYLTLASILAGHTIAAANTLVDMQRWICFRRNGISNCMGTFSNIPNIIGFTILEILMSQGLNLNKFWTLFISTKSLMSVVCLGHVSIGIGLALFGKIISGPKKKGSFVKQDWMIIFEYAGGLAFECAVLLLATDDKKLQDKLKSSSSPPNHDQAKVIMNRFRVLTMTLLFMMCAVIGYEESDLPVKLESDVFTDFRFLINLCTLVYLVFAYQVLCQPIFQIVEWWASERWPKSGIITKDYPIGLRKMTLIKINMLRLIWRPAFVMMVTFLSSHAMRLPYQIFSSVIALVGAVSYWPIGVHFPVEIHIARNKIAKPTFRWFALRLFSFMCFLVWIAAVYGAVDGLSNRLNKYNLKDCRQNLINIGDDFMEYC